MFCRSCGNQNKDDALFCVYCGSQMANNMMYNVPMTQSPVIQEKQKKTGISDKTKTGLLITLGTLTLFVAVLFVLVIISLSKDSTKTEGGGEVASDDPKQKIEACIGESKYSEAYDLIMNTEGLDEETKKAYLETVYYDSLVATNSSKPKQSGSITDEYTLESAGWYPSDMQSDGVVLNGDAKHPVLKYTYKNGNGDVKTIYMVYDGKEYKEITEEEALAIANNAGDYDIRNADSVPSYYADTNSGNTAEIEGPVGDLPDPEVSEPEGGVADGLKDDFDPPEPVAEEPVATPEDAIETDEKKQNEQTYYLVKTILVHNEDGSLESFTNEYDFDKGEVTMSYFVLNADLMHPEYPARDFSSDMSWHFYPNEALPFITRYCYKPGDKVLAEENLTFDDKGKLTKIETHDLENPDSDVSIDVKGTTVEWGNDTRLITYDTKGRIISARQKIDNKTDEYKLDYSYDPSGYLKEFRCMGQSGQITGKEYWDQKAGDDKNRVWKSVNKVGEEEVASEMTYCYDDNGCCTKRLNSDGNVVTEYTYIKVTVSADGKITVSE